MLLLTLIPSSALAHFSINVNIRIIHLIHEDGTVRLLMRSPLSYFIADKLGPIGIDGQPTPAPFSSNSYEDGVLQHYVDAHQLRANPQGLARIAADGFELRVAGEKLKPTLGRVRAFPSQAQTLFTTREAAERALAGPVYAPEFNESYVGDTLVDIELIYPTTEQARLYSLTSSLNPKLPKQEQTANLIIVHRPQGAPIVYRALGLLDRTITISASMVDSMLAFTKEGFGHIFGGLDHVLFVLCLILSAFTLSALAWRITGFTLGHSITLSLGFFGYTPQATWFINTIEVAIALSIIYAAAMVFIKQRQGTLVITALIGLLHGLGFSFILQRLLSADAPYLWHSLFAFNVGIELGQLTMVLALWPALWALDQKYCSKMMQLRRWLVMPIIAIAMVWVGQRSLLLLEGLI